MNKILKGYNLALNAIGNRYKYIESGIQSVIFRANGTNSVELRMSREYRSNNREALRSWLRCNGEHKPYATIIDILNLNRKAKREIKKIRFQYELEDNTGEDDQENKQSFIKNIKKLISYKFKPIKAGIPDFPLLNKNLCIVDNTMIFKWGQVCYSFDFVELWLPTSNYDDYRDKIFFKLKGSDEIVNIADYLRLTNMSLNYVPVEKNYVFKNSDNEKQLSALILETMGAAANLSLFIF